MSQLVLLEATLTAAKPKWTHTLLIPAACAGLSIVLLLLHVIVTTTPVKHLIARLRSREVKDDDLPQQLVLRQHTGFFPDLRTHIKGHGGPTVFTWKVLRLLACLALTGLTIAAIVSITEGHNTIGTDLYNLSDELDVDPDMDEYELRKEGKKHKEHRKRRARWFSTAEWIEISLCMFYTYTTLLAILALTLAPRFRAISNTHLVILLLVAIGVYAWRDLVPLATYHLHPADAAGEWLTWSRIGVLTFASLIVPLCIPRVYVPLDPKNPSASPNPEQTASLISLLLYNFLDPVVWAAYRAPKLEYDQLPPLADYDRASHLRQRGFDKLDPRRRTKQRHLFWGLMEVFWREYCIMAVTISIRAPLEFAGPVGIKYLLEYLQNIQKHEDPGYFRPWFWILWLFLGPVIGSMALQWYTFIAARSLVQTEGMVTQLLFEHSLRIRMVAQVAGGSSGKTPKTSTPGGDSGSIAGSERTAAEGQPQSTKGTGEGESNSTGHTAEESNAQTLVASTSSMKQQDKGDGQDDDKEVTNLVGKINNLMSTDLGHMVEGRDFLLLLLYGPIQIIFSIFFLYRILGWSAIIGMTIMIVSIPIPGKVAHLINNAQVSRMKKTDARVQTVTESMNVIRMIKLFGWEKKVVGQVEEKREEELIYYRKRQLLGLVNSNI
ncbi:ABC transporter, partial [Rhizoctonia solani 123E]